MLELIQAQYAGGYRIHVRFSDGADGIVDLANSLWGPVFEPLKDPERFQRFTLSPTLHTICWENDADLAPEFLRKALDEQNSRSAP